MKDEVRFNFIICVSDQCFRPFPCRNFSDTVTGHLFVGYFQLSHGTVKYFSFIKIHLLVVVKFKRYKPEKQAWLSRNFLRRLDVLRSQTGSLRYKNSFYRFTFYLFCLTSSPPSTQSSPNTPDGDCDDRARNAGLAATLRLSKGRNTNTDKIVSP